MAKINVITIVTVVKNAEKTLKSTIDSVVNQMNKHIEYIIVDGGSTDDTLRVLDSYKKKISKIICEPDNGVYDAMNKALKLASGEVIAFLNADDKYEGGIIPKVLDFFDLDTMDIVYGDTINVYSNGFNELMKTKDISQIVYGMPFCHQSAFIKTDLLRNFGGYDAKYVYCADYKFFLQCYRSDKRFRRMNVIISYCSMSGLSNINAVECAKEQKKISLKYAQETERAGIIEYNDKMIKLAKLRLKIQREPDSFIEEVGKLIMMNTRTRFVIWGAGIWGRRVGTALEHRYSISYYIDMYKVQSDEGDEISIRSNLGEVDSDLRVIITTLRDNEEIKNYLKSRGVPKEAIVTLSEIMNLLDENE